MDRQEYVKERTVDEAIHEFASAVIGGNIDAAFQQAIAYGRTHPDSPVDVCRIIIQVCRRVIEQRVPKGQEDEEVMVAAFLAAYLCGVFEAVFNKSQGEE